VLPLKQNLLSQFKGGLIHLSPERLHLHAWFLSGIISDRNAFLKQLPSTGQCENPLASSMMQSEQSFLIGVLEERLIHSKSRNFKSTSSAGSKGVRLRADNTRPRFH
jgi:hypothetical protein